MRHLMEVILVVEGKEGWARSVAEGRRQQGLPLPSVELMGTEDTITTSSSSSSSSSSMNVAALVRRIVETKEVGRVVISFL